ncbi:hypothetical protein BDZ97DRAFT_1789054 [Flammula alnicola]|nr:hypothetical protein BDZ97DRAFT_1789054 [Flammula alnicola]
MSLLSFTIDSESSRDSDNPAGLDIPSIIFPPAPDTFNPFLPNGQADSYVPPSPSSVEITQERLWNDLSSLYSANDQLKSDSAALDPAPRDLGTNSGGDNAQKLDNLLESFMYGANAVLEELTVLGNAHPVLAIAIFAFHEVIKLDIARRDNNKKVLVVVLQMQSMMGPMFELRNLKHDHMPEAEKQFHENRLKELVEIITRDIKVCRSDITHYMNRKFVYKLVLAKGYERNFATHIETFALRRSELQSVISAYLAVSVTTANIAIAEVGKKVNIRDVLKFMLQNGGPEKCVNDLDLLPKLISKAGESPKTGKLAISNQAELLDLQKSLKEAIGEDLDKVLERHYSRFEKVLQVQSNNLKRMSAHLEDQGVLMQTHTTKLGKILDTVTTIMVLEEGKLRTKSVKLKDPNLTSSSVKAKLFVLTFRDHIRTDNSGTGTPIGQFASLPGADAGSTLLLPNRPNQNKDSDEWVLEYIDVAFVQPIVEAMDEDGSGFISVKEANNFALARPKGLSLLHWIAYWAAGWFLLSLPSSLLTFLQGWHINITKHQRDIYSVLLHMHEALPSVHPANRTHVDDYLDDSSLRRVEALLRSIKPVPDNSRKDPKLMEVATTVAASQLDRLKANLNEMGFFIESPLDATTIAGFARVETWILPLLLLLLQRHLAIIKLAQTVVLDEGELDYHVTSLSSIFSVFDERMQNLEAKFRQLHRDIDAQFESFSYGMFLAAFKKTEFLASENTLLTLKMDETDDDTQDLKPKPGQAPDISILSKPLGKSFDVEEVDLTPIPPPVDHIPHPMEGMWFGWFTWDGGHHRRPYRCRIDPIVENKLTGTGDSFFGKVKLVGQVGSGTVASEEPINVEFKVLSDAPDYRSQLCTGLYNPDKDAVEGMFVWTNVYNEGVPGESSKADEARPDEQTESKDVGTEDQVANENKDTDENEDTDKNEDRDEKQQIKEEDPVEDKTQDQDTDLNTQDEVADEEEDQTESKDPVDGRFYLTRTPATAFRFRYLLDGPGPAPCWTVWTAARKRWAFATEAILFETRHRMGSAKAFRELLSERRKWLNVCIRYDLTDSSITSEWNQYEPLSDQDWDVYTAMIGTVNPANAKIYEALGHYLCKRMAYVVGRIGCDSCYKLISFNRYQCIICMEDDLSDHIDLCENCFDKRKTVRSGTSFSHSLSHSVIRSRHRIHKYEVNTLISEARLISERSKGMFRALEAKNKEVQGHSYGKSRKGRHDKGAKNPPADDEPAGKPAAADVTPLYCACCHDPVSTPCWVCVTCSPLTFICLRCDRKNAPGQFNQFHLREHHLLRIHDSIEVKPIRLNKINDVERQLEEIKTNLSSLEEKVNTQLEEAREMKAVVGEMAKTIGLKEDDLFSSVTDLDDVELGEQTEDSNVEADDQGGESGPSQTDSQSTELETSNQDDRIDKHVKSKLDFGERLTMLEAKVDRISDTLQSMLQEDKSSSLVAKMEAMEAKMEKQLGTMLALMQEFVSTPRPSITPP